RVLLGPDPEQVTPASEAGTELPADANAANTVGGAARRVAAAFVDQPGVWFGPYRLRESLGEGGMGRVWLADQEKPIRRTVAIKVVKLGADSVLSRFDSERQALAILNHPHI